MDGKYFKRENYLKKVRPFIKDTDLIKVITGIRRCGKSCLMKTIAQELAESGVQNDHLVFLDLDERGLRSVKTPDQLETAIEARLPQDQSKAAGPIYLFVDEVQNVKDYEEVINAYRNDGNFSVFITGSNSYLLSGELITKLTGRYIEIELFTLSFAEYLGMRHFLGKEDTNTSQSFQDWLRYGGFPKAAEYDDFTAKSLYIEDVVEQIIKKDIYGRNKVRNKLVFEKLMTYIINNYAAPTNLSNIAAYLKNVAGISVKTQTLASYIDLLVKAKIIYRCDRFDMKSKSSLKGGEKYYLADTGIYFARNVNANMDYGPLLENAVYTYLKSHDYRVSIGIIGKLEIDFIARKANDGYSYIQVSMSIADKSVEEREYRPFQKVRDNWPQYLLTLDPLQNQRDGVKHINLIDLMAKNDGL